MKTGYFTKFGTTLLLTPALLIGTLPLAAQSYGRDNNRNQPPQQLQRRDQNRDQSYNRDRDQDRNNQYRRDYDRDSPSRDYDRDRGTGYVAYTPAYRGDYGYVARDNGIGPGKGAAIGAVSGGVLGALFGGGKGALIGGAAGAGVGAVAGQAAQNHRYSRY